MNKEVEMSTECHLSVKLRGFHVFHNQPRVCIRASTRIHRTIDRTLETVHLKNEEINFWVLIGKLAVN